MTVNIIRQRTKTIDQTNTIWPKLQEAKHSKRLGFLIALDKDLDYTKHLCSIGRLRELMDILRVDHTNIGPKKEAVVSFYRKNAAPKIDLFVLGHLNAPLSSLPASSSQSPISDSYNQIGRLSPSTPTSSTDDLQAQVTAAKPASQVHELRKGLSKSLEKMISRGFNKAAVVKIHRDDKGKHLGSQIIPKKAGNLSQPCKISLEDMAKHNRDTIRQALHSHYPQLWIPINVATRRPMLLSLYNAFILGNEEPTLCQGVHYDIFPIDQLNLRDCCDPVTTEVANRSDINL